MLTLLDEGYIDASRLMAVIEGSKSEKDFDKATEKYVRVPKEQYKILWANSGVGRTIREVWIQLLKNHYHSSVENTLQSMMKISYADIVNNYEATEDIYRDVARVLEDTDYSYGKRLHTAIQEATKETYSNNRVKYQRLFRVQTSDPNLNQTLAEGGPTALVKVTDGMEALSNIPASEVKVLLTDIYGARYLYKYESESVGNIYYGMWESFLRVYFYRQMQEFNETHRGNVSLSLPGHLEAKYKKLDQIMDSVLDQFVLKGITKENLYEFLSAVFYKVDNVAVSSTVKVFGTAKLDVDQGEGNFNIGQTFVSKGAPKRFSQFIKGFLATSKLYRYLLEAGVEPYKVHYDIFRFTYEDPSNKFLDLSEVVKHSFTYVNVRRKYELNDQFYTLKALSRKRTGGSALPRTYDEAILTNRNKNEIASITKTVTNLINPNPDLCYATIHMPDQNRKVNIFLLARYLQQGLNPLYILFQKDSPEWTDYLGDDEEEVLDEYYMQNHIAKFYNIEDPKYAEYKLSREDFLDMKDELDGGIKEFFNDLTNNELDVQIKILVALEDFILEFQNFMDSFHEKYKHCVVTEIEYSSFLCSHELFADMHDLVDVSKNRVAGDRLEALVMHALLHRKDNTITYEEVNQFLLQRPSNVSYENFLGSVHMRTFKSIINYFYYAKANLYNLATHGRPVRLGDKAREEALRNAPHQDNMEEFVRRHQGINKGRDGYLLDELGELYRVIAHNNKIGALHSTGFFIFTDKTVMPWGVE